MANYPDNILMLPSPLIGLSKLSTTSLAPVLGTAWLLLSWALGIDTQITSWSTRMGRYVNMCLM